MRPLTRFCVVAGLGAVGMMASAALLRPATGLFMRAGDPGARSDVFSLARLPERSIVYARDGSTLAVLHAEENRSPVALAQVPRPVIDAVVDTEDASFWTHPGVDLRATLRALVTNVHAHAVRQGGSTITQQLVKNAVLTNTRSFGRKIKEALLAIRLEGELSKNEILERYLNTVYLGNGAYGIKAAAENYYGLPVERLTVGQGAFLAGMISNPDGFDPFRFPERSRQRRDYVADRMVASHHLTRGEADRVKTEPLPTKVVEALKPPDAQDGYFVEEVKQRLLADPDLGDTSQARYNAVFRGGLKIYTTLDPTMQAAAKFHMADILPSEDGKWTATLVAVDPKTGAVRAMVGGQGFDRSQYRIATEGPGRQPGSSFKPIILAAALEQGYSIYASVDGTSPCTFETGGGTTWTPGNVEGEEIGDTNLTNALALSVNCAYARLGLRVGIDKVTSMARRLGITTALPQVPSMVLGADEVRPIDMVGAFATFANDGVHHTPYVVERVEDRDGKVILTGGDKGTQALTSQKAREEVLAMRSVVEYGTGVAAKLSDRQVAGKTGTTDNHGNAWFIGYTPQLATAVWMGSPVGNLPMYSVGGTTATGTFEDYRSVFGGTYPAIIWHEFMADVLRNQPSPDFTPPDMNDLGDITEVIPPPGSYSPTTTTSSTTTIPAPTTTVQGGTTTTGPSSKTAPSSTTAPPATSTPPSSSTTSAPSPSTTARPPP